MAARAAALVAVAVAACLGCGKPTPPKTAVLAPVEPAAAEPEAPPDLSPVDAPEDLIVVGRLSRPRVLFETLASWSGVPVRVTDVLPGEAKELSGVVAWDAPIEIAGVLDRRSTDKLPAPLFVVSIGLASTDGAIELARNRGVNVTQVAPGIVRLRAGDEVSCAISVAVGSAPGRLVCGDDWRDVEELLPYATRGLPTANLGASDLHVELRAAPLQKRYAQELAAIRPIASILLRSVQTDSKRLDRAMTDIVYALADEARAYATELRRVEVTARLDEAKKVLDVGYAVAHDGQTSVVGQMLREAGKRSSPAPDAFWQLPSGADMAMYGVATEPKRAEQWALALGELADAYFEQEKVGAPFRKKLRAAIESYVPAFWAPSSSVSGSPEEAAAPAAFNGFLSRGWSVTVIEARADRVTKSLSDVAALVTDRELAKIVKERAELDPKHLPKVRRGTVQVKGFPARATTFTIEFPPALLDFLSDRKDRDKVGPDAAAPKKPVSESLVIVVVPDGERSFVGAAPNQKLAVKKLEAARSAGEPKLAAVAELEPLRRERAAFAGYWTLASLLDALVGYAEQQGKRGEVDGMLNRMPNRGRSFWMFRFAVTEQGTAHTSAGSVRIPHGAFQDLGSVGLELARRLAGLNATGSSRLAGH